VNRTVMRHNLPPDILSMFSGEFLRIASRVALLDKERLMRWDRMLACVGTKWKTGESPRCPLHIYSFPATASVSELAVFPSDDPSPECGVRFWQS
jgi:hypothetical protein